MEKQVVLDGKDEFQTCLKPVQNHQVGFSGSNPPWSRARVLRYTDKAQVAATGARNKKRFSVSNHLFSPRDRVWRRPYKAKRIVSTDSSTPKLQKAPSF